MTDLSYDDNSQETVQNLQQIDDDLIVIIKQRLENPEPNFEIDLDDL